ncbi:MAG TPA: hypothetical protein VGN91_24985 [Bosea sp. (in: a-proteobacteria)]|jgi:hypothetical protein|uniref:hypothetical protein n=1 Tax=Bosea sp. CRIB-10 TaxID=378404 RepID=UPI0008EAFE6B|nr:hypothetical protein [Bosea sp. CRIB-10]SFD46886.1 hypothetical protein SAMN05428997_12947 [Bosea sp. CRIB-10]HEV7328328.1 hypothetical protein [Bosea sp. (in: a-proteobacteria)]
MRKLNAFPCFVLCGPFQGYGPALPAFGRFERIEWPMYSRGDFTRPLRFTGMLDLDGPHALAYLHDSEWAVVQIDRDDPCDWVKREDGTVEPGLVCFASGFVLFRGPRRTALNIFTAYKSGMPLKTPLSAFQDRTGVASAGDFGVAIAGDEGFARAGFCGVAQAGMAERRGSSDIFAEVDWSGYWAFGVALAGVRGNASAGREGIAVVESGGHARAAHSGVAIARRHPRKIGIARGHFGKFSVVEAGGSGIAISQASEGSVTVEAQGVAVATENTRWLAVGRGGIGVAQGDVEQLDIADDALVVAAGLESAIRFRLGRRATLIMRHRRTEGVVRVFTTCGGNLEPKVYSYWDDELHEESTDRLGSVDIEPWESEKDDAVSLSKSPAPAFPSGLPWWVAARNHDPEAEILQEPIREGEIVVLCGNIPAAELAAGRKDGKLWLGALMGQGDLPLSDGAQCCLVRVEGEHALGQGRGEMVGFRQGTALYRGTLRGAVASLRAVGADKVLDGHIALAGPGGVARVASRMDPVPLPPPHPADIEERYYGTPSNLLRGDRTIGRYPSLAVAGDEGFAICDGEAHAGDRGVACTRGLGVARAGANGLALCENGRAIAGESGIALSLPLTYPGELDHGGQAVAGEHGIAIAEWNGTTAIAGESGIAIARGPSGGQARAGDLGVAIGAGGEQVAVHGGGHAVVVAKRGRVSGFDGALLVAWDEATKRWVHGLVGRDGIEPGVAYVARNGRFEPWTSPVLVEFRHKHRRRPR